MAELLMLILLLIVCFGLIGGPVGLIMLVIGLTRERTRKTALVTLGICATLFGVGVLLIVTSPPPEGCSCYPVTAQQAWGCLAGLLALLIAGVRGLTLRFRNAGHPMR